MPAGETIAILAAAAALGLGLGWAVARLASKPEAGDAEGVLLAAGLHAFETALIVIDRGAARLLGDAESLSSCAAALGVADADPEAVIAVIAGMESDASRKLERWRRHGEACAFSLSLGPGRLAVDGRASGALAFLRLRFTPAPAPAVDRRGRAAAPPAPAAVFEAISDAVAVFGADRRLAFHNAAFAQLCGLAPAWLAGQPGHGEILDRLRQGRLLPETLDYARFKADELARHERAEAGPETLWRLPSERTLRVAGLPLPDGGLAMVFADITDELRRRAEFNQLIQVQSATLDKLSDAVAVFASDGRLSLYNQAFLRFWDIGPAQVGTMTGFDAVVELCVRHLHDLQFWRELKGRITDPDPASRAEAAGEQALGDGRIAAWRSRPLPDGATLVSFSDITDTRRLEDALADREAALGQAERLTREFVGSVSYELRTPLTTILGYAELLEAGADQLPPSAQSAVGAVRAAAAELAGSVNDILDMAEIDAGELVLETDDVDVERLLAAAAERWQGRARATGAAIRIADYPPAGLIRADPRRLAQVLDHLIRNSLAHSPPGATVTLSAERGQGEVALQVADTGRGIPFHVQAHIFDRFAGQERGSAGLGLALVRALVELHGGWVAVESEPGAGAAFTCHLPEAATVSGDRPELF